VLALAVGHLAKVPGLVLQLALAAGSLAKVPGLVLQLALAVGSLAKVPGLVLQLALAVGSLAKVPGLVLQLALAAQEAFLGPRQVPSPVLFPLDPFRCPAPLLRLHPSALAKSFCPWLRVLLMVKRRTPIGGCFVLVLL
jgi:hypothetical protein